MRPSLRLPGEVGLFAACDLAPGERLFGKQEEMFTLPYDEFERLPDVTRRWVLKWCVGWPEGFLVPADPDSLSLTYYFNHSCEGNVGFGDDGLFVTVVPVAAGEELVYDYALVDVTTEPIIATCACGSASCRGRVSGLDYRDESWWRRQGGHAHPVVRAARAAWEVERTASAD